MNKLMGKWMAPEPAIIERWASRGKGRSSCASYNGMMWALTPPIGHNAAVCTARYHLGCLSN